MKPLCIYHGNCADGFTAAWVVRRFFSGDVDFHPGVYQTPPPDVEGRDVLLVDFSYKAPVLHEMAGKANSILVLDHHKTAAADLEHAGKAGSNWHEHLTNAYQDRCEGVTHSLYALFDMDRSGAGIAWDYFFPHDPRPTLVNHIEDRDLWRFALSGTREIQASVFSYPYDFDTWDMLFRADLAVLRTEGEAIERKHFKDVNELIGVVTRRMVIGGHNVPIANLPYIHVSDAAHALCKGEPFAGCYWDTPKGRVFGLRSTDAGLDVSDIAKQYGGGGHRNAAGFTVSYDVARTLEATSENKWECNMIEPHRYLAGDLAVDEPVICASDYDALAAENARLKARLADCELALDVWDTGRCSEYWLRVAVQPDAPCEECGGTGIVERKEDSAPMECWACSPQPQTSKQK